MWPCLTVTKDKNSINLVVTLDLKYCLYMALGLMVPDGGVFHSCSVFPASENNLEPNGGNDMYSRTQLSSEGTLFDYRLSRARRTPYIFVKHTSYDVRTISK
jgi:hypothetical protein